MTRNILATLLTSSTPATGEKIPLPAGRKTFALGIKGAAAVSASAEIWWSPTGDAAIAHRIGSLNSTGTLAAGDFTPPADYAGGLTWAVLLTASGGEAFITVGV